MKVLVITTTFPRWKNDTTAGFIFDLSKGLMATGMEIFVLAPHHPGAEFYEEMEGLKVHRFPYFFPIKYECICYNGGIIPNIKRNNLAKIQAPLLFLSELYYTIKIIRKENINVIHTHWIIPSGLIGGIFRRILKKPHITTAHAGDVFTIRKSKMLGFLSSFVFRNSDKITANSKFTKDVIIYIDKKSENNVNIIPMGVDTSRFNPNKASNLRNNFEAEYLILSVGRLVDKKGIEYLIMAMKEVIKEFPRTKLIIGGFGPEKETLEKLSKKLGLEEYIVFVGYIKNSDLPEYYASSDIFVLPSIETKGGDTEGLGVVLLEAMASGTPVIGSEIGGITDIIYNGETGILIKPENPKNIAETIIKLLSDVKMQQMFSERGLKMVRERFSWEVVTKRFTEIFKDLK